MKDSLHKLVRRPWWWRSRDLRLVIPGRAFSYFGDSLTLVVLSLRVAESGNPVDMSVLLMAFGLPVFVLAGVCGRIVDEHDSRLLLVAAGSLQVAASLGLVFAPSLGAIVAAVVLLQVGQAVTGPTWGALVPRIVGEETVGRAIATQQALVAFAGLAGSAAAGLLYGTLGYRATMALDTATFLVLVVVGASVRARRGRRYDGAAKAVGRSVGGWRSIRTDHLLALLAPAVWVFILVGEGTNVVEVYLIRNDLGGSSETYGLLTALGMSGVIVGPILAGRLREDRDRVFWATMSAIGIGLSGLGFAVSWAIWVLIPLLLLAGIAAGAINALLGTLIVTHAAEAVRGRVLSTLNGVGRGFSVLAMVLGGVSGQLLGARVTFFVSGLLCLAVASLIFRSRRGLTLIHDDGETKATTQLRLQET